MDAELCQRDYGLMLFMLLLGVGIGKNQAIRYTSRCKGHDSIYCNILQIFRNVMYCNMF